MPGRPFDLPEPEILAQPVQPEAAIAFWAWKSATPYNEVKKLADGARERAFYVTALAERDAVQAVKDALGKALENGETFQDFKKRIGDVIDQQGWRGDRIETIFRNNLQTAYSAGRYAKMQATRQARPYWRYLTVGDERVRPSHAVLNGMVFPADHDFWSDNYPPNGHKCRCAVTTLSARQVERQGLTVQTETPGDSMYTDPKTGMEYHVARPGADDGWRNNPGKAWMEGGASAGLPLHKYPDMPEMPTQRLPDVSQDAIVEPSPADPIEKLVGVKQGKPIEWTPAAGKANPRYREGRPYQENCQRCVPAYELLRRGYNVEALPRPTVEDKAKTGGKAGYVGYEGFKDVQVFGRYAGRDGITINKEGLLRQLKAMPDGARAGIVWVWPRGRAGHTVVCEKIDGKVQFIDPQTGKIDDTALGKASRKFGYTFYRMDTCELRDDFAWDDIVKAGS